MSATAIGTAIGVVPLLATGLSPAAAAVHRAPPHHAVRGDFDGDGRPDLAVGAPGVAPRAGGDRVRIIYTHAKVTGSHGVWLDDPTTVGFHPYFGQALASADFNNDGFADLAVGAPGYYGPNSQDGAIYIFLGSHTGLHYSGKRIVGPDEFDLDNEVGTALAAGDLNGDGYSDLVEGNPGPGGGGDEQGSIAYFLGGPTGLSTAAAGGYTSTAQVPEGFFGASVAIGDVNGDGHKDLVVGEPGGGKPTAATYGAGSGAGDVQIIYGTSSGPGTHRTTIYGKFVNAKGHLGAAVATGDINHDGYADIAAGAPTATVNGHKDAGKAVVFYGGKHGISAGRSKTISRQSPGVPGNAGVNDRFGFSVALGDLTGNHHANLIVGLPGARILGNSGVGAVDLFRSAAGVITAHARQVSAASHGVPPDPIKGSNFGFAVATRGTAKGQRSLLVGIPFKHAGGQMVQIPGGPRLVSTRHAQVISDPQPFDRLGEAFPA